MQVNVIYVRLHDEKCLKVSFRDGKDLKFEYGQKGETLNLLVNFIMNTT